jgi:hypothetical protein
MQMSQPDDSSPGTRVTRLRRFGLLALASPSPIAATSKAQPRTLSKGAAAEKAVKLDPLSAAPWRDETSTLPPLPISLCVISLTPPVTTHLEVRGLSREPLTDESTLRIPFTALKSRVTRGKAKELILRLIATLPGAPRSGEV